MIVSGASWCDLVKHADGRVELVYLTGTTVSCARRWTLDVGHSLLYLSAAADRGGRVLAAGQGEDRAGTVRTAIDGVLGPELGGTPFPFSVLVRGESDGWTVFIQRTSRSYDEVRVTGDGRVTSTEPRTFASLDPERPEQSQGFLFVASDGTPLTQDHGRNAIPGMTLPSPAPSDLTVWAGQSLTAATIALFDSRANQIIPLDTPGGQPPHLVESGGTYYVCSYVDGGAWLSTHRRPFAAVTPPVEPPPVTPPVNPPQETPVRLEQKHSDLIEAFAARFPPPGGNEDELRDHWTPKLVEQMVFSFPGEGWCWKSTSPGGRPSSDVIARQAGGGMWGYDLIPNAGLSSWRLDAHAGPIDLRTQAPIRMNPVNHLGAATPPNPGTPPVTPPAARPFPEVYMPWDVQVDILTKFIEGIWPKDRVPEVTETGLTGSGTLSRGALGFLIPIQFKTLVAWVTAHGTRAPVGMEWWDVAAQVVTAAVAEYRRSQPTPE